MQLSKEQQHVFESVTADIRGGQRQVIYAGSAGTGKTTLLSSLAKELADFVPVTWTGKAARRMEEVGILGAATIHSTIYTPVFYGNRIVGFRLKDRYDVSGNGFLVDEASTLSRTLYRDLTSFGLPCVFVGDHKQLEPVGDDAKLMANPDYTLEEIHRNAGDIAHFAGMLSRDESVSGFKSDKVTLLERRDITDELLLEVDQVICAFNATRVDINQRIHAALGRSDPPQPGDRVICLKNNRKLGLFNGMQGIVTNSYPEVNYFDLDIDGEPHPWLQYDPNQFNREAAPRRDLGRDDPMPFDLAYCCTAHKFQGSEADKVLVIAQHCNKWDMARWNYTAASRAKKHLYWAM